MGYTKKQILVLLILVLGGAVAWELQNIFLFFDSVFWRHYWNSFPHIQLSWVFQVIGKRMLFPGVIVFFTLTAIKHKMNAVQYTFIWIAGIVVAYGLYQGATRFGTNSLWISGWERTWPPMPFSGYNPTDEGLLYGLLGFDPFKYWLSGCAICFYANYSAKKPAGGKDQRPLLVFGILFAMTLAALCVDMTGYFLRSASDPALVLGVLSQKSVSIFARAIFQMGLIWLAYVTYIKRLPRFWFGLSCAALFLVTQLANSFSGGMNNGFASLVLFNSNATAIHIGAALLFFALESKSFGLIAVSAVSLALMPLAYALYNTAAMRSFIYTTFGYGISSPRAPYGAYILPFVLPPLMALFIKEYRDMKGGAAVDRID